MPQNINAGKIRSWNAAPQPAAVPPSKDTDWVTVPAVIPRICSSRRCLHHSRNAKSIRRSVLYNTIIFRVVLERQQSTGMNGGVLTWPAGQNGIQTIAELSAEQPYIRALPQAVGPRRP